MRRDNADTVGIKRVLADFEDGYALAVVVVVVSAAHFQPVAEIISLVACPFSRFDCVGGRFSLGLCLVEEVLVAVAVLVHFVDFFLGRNLKEIAFFVGQLVHELLSFALLFSHVFLLSAKPNLPTSPRKYLTYSVYYLSEI